MMPLHPSTIISELDGYHRQLEGQENANANNNNNYNDGQWFYMTYGPYAAHDELTGLQHLYQTNCEPVDTNDNSNKSNQGKTCTTCSQDGSFCVKETCYYKNFQQSCTTCAIHQQSNNGNNNNGVIVDDYEFCVDTSCFQRQRPLDKRCHCTTAILNGQTCNRCNMCRLPHVDRNAMTWSETSGTLAEGLELQCDVNNNILQITTSTYTSEDGTPAATCHAMSDSWYLTWSAVGVLMAGAVAVAALVARRMYRRHWREINHVTKDGLVRDNATAE